MAISSMMIIYQATILASELRLFAEKVIGDGYCGRWWMLCLFNLSFSLSINQTDESPSQH